MVPSSFASYFSSTTALVSGDSSRCPLSVIMYSSFAKDSVRIVGMEEV